MKLKGFLALLLCSSATYAVGPGEDEGATTTTTAVALPTTTTSASSTSSTDVATSSSTGGGALVSALADGDNDDDDLTSSDSDSTSSDGGSDFESLNSSIFDSGCVTADGVYYQDTSLVYPTSCKTPRDLEALRKLPGEAKVAQIDVVLKVGRGEPKEKDMNDFRNWDLKGLSHVYMMAKNTSAALQILSLCPQDPQITLLICGNTPYTKIMGFKSIVNQQPNVQILYTGESIEDKNLREGGLAFGASLHTSMTRGINKYEDDLYSFYNTLSDASELQEVGFYANQLIFTQLSREERKDIMRGLKEVIGSQRPHVVKVLKPFQEERLKRHPALNLLNSASNGEDFSVEYKELIGVVSELTPALLDKAMPLFIQHFATHNGNIAELLLMIVGCQSPAISETKLSQASLDKVLSCDLSRLEPKAITNLVIAVEETGADKGVINQALSLYSWPDRFVSALSKMEGALRDKVVASAQPQAARFVEKYGETPIEAALYPTLDFVSLLGRLPEEQITGDVAKQMADAWTDVIVGTKARRFTPKRNDHKDFSKILGRVEKISPDKRLSLVMNILNLYAVEREETLVVTETLDALEALYDDPKRVAWFLDFQVPSVFREQAIPAEGSLRDKTVLEKFVAIPVDNRGKAVEVLKEALKGFAGSVSKALQVQTRILDLFGPDGAALKGEQSAQDLATMILTGVSTSGDAASSSSSSTAATSSGKGVSSTSNDDDDNDNDSSDDDETDSTDGESDDEAGNINKAHMSGASKPAGQPPARGAQAPDPKNGSLMSGLASWLGL